MVDDLVVVARNELSKGCSPKASTFINRSSETKTVDVPVGRDHASESPSAEQPVTVRSEQKPAPWTGFSPDKLDTLLLATNDGAGRPLLAPSHCFVTGDTTGRPLAVEHRSTWIGSRTLRVRTDARSFSLRCAATSVGEEMLRPRSAGR
jgi:hypothetical protein